MRSYPTFIFFFLGGTAFAQTIASIDSLKRIFDQDVNLDTISISYILKLARKFVPTLSDPGRVCAWREEKRPYFKIACRIAFFSPPSLCKYNSNKNTQP
jgi:hypothetical protein